MARNGGLLLSCKTPTLSTVIPLIQQRPLLSSHSVGSSCLHSGPCAAIFETIGYDQFWVLRNGNLTGRTLHAGEKKRRQSRLPGAFEETAGLSALHEFGSGKDDVQALRSGSLVPRERVAAEVQSSFPGWVARFWRLDVLRTSSMG